MNLNTFARHGVVEHDATTDLVAAKLRDPALIARARVFPYQLMVAFANASWFLFPVLVIVRMWREHPFTREKKA